jgi:hypothetical protein
LRAERNALHGEDRDPTQYQRTAMQADGYQTKQPVAQSSVKLRSAATSTASGAAPFIVNPLSHILCHDKFTRLDNGGPGIGVGCHPQSSVAG